MEPVALICLGASLLLVLAAAVIPAVQQRRKNDA